MENQFIIYLLLSVVITSLSWFVYVTKIKSNYANLKTTHENLHENLDKEVIVKTDENVKALQNSINDLKAQISEVKQSSYNEGYQNARGEFSIKVFPHKQEFTHGDDGFFINDIFHQVEIGYQYQLFVNGIPVLKPAIIIEETLTEEKKQVDYNKVNNAVKMLEARLMPIVTGSKGLMQMMGKTANKN